MPSHCEGTTAVYCDTPLTGPPYSNRVDCAARGPEATCVEAEDRVLCDLIACDPTTFSFRCESEERGVTCERTASENEALYVECSSGTRCVVSEGDETRVVCVPSSATPSTHGPTPSFQGLGCTPDGQIRVQRYGFEWDQACEPNVVFVDGEWMTVATRCVARDGLAACIPVDEPAVCADGWTCVSGMAACADGAARSYFPCAAGCIPDTGLCLDPQPCNAATFAGRTWTGARECCIDTDGDGRGVTYAGNWLSCP